MKIELRMSSNGHGNSQGHYLTYSRKDKVTKLVEQAKEYAYKYDYLTNDIHFTLWHISDQPTPARILIEWNIIAQVYPKMPIIELFRFAYDEESKDYPLLTFASLTYWEGNKITEKECITVRGVY